MARMNVLLTQDVDNVGLAGEIHAVSGGYARNYLMPRGLAMLATKGALKQAEEIRQAGIRRRAQLRANAEEQASLINGKQLLFTANAGENDRLYGSVTSADVAAKLQEAVGFEIDRRKVQLHQPLRTLGLFDLEMRLMYEVTASFQVAVVREGENWSAAVARSAVLASEAEAQAAAVAEVEAEVAAMQAEEELNSASDDADESESDDE